MITPKQIKIIHTLLQKHGQMDNKKDIIKNASATGKESTKELTQAEAAALIGYLQTSNTKPETPNQDGQQMINYIIAASHEMKWITLKNKVEPGGRIVKVNDYSKMHQELEKLCYKKPLKKYTVPELTKLVTVIKKINLAYLQKKKPA